jgi:hypothetical protein
MSYVQNPLVPWLLSHSYGQGGSVAIPSAASEPTVVPLGEFPPGINELLDHLVDKYSSWRADAPEIDWCFLVGGPGNGKSEALRLLAGCLDLALPARASGQPVPRTIPIGWPANRQPLASGLSPAFVNDASIPRPAGTGTNSTGSLQQDICDALRETTEGRATALFVNVNRGILVEECASIGTPTGTPADLLAGGILRWLSAPQDSLAVEGLSAVSLPSPTAPYYAQLRVELSALGIESCVVIHVVFLDVLSLFEPRPGAATKAIDFSASPPTAAKYQTFGRLISDDITRDDTTAGGLLKSYVELARWQDGGCKDPGTGTPCQAAATCPFAQNAGWLQHAALRHRFLDTLRAAEIAAARRFSYRDLLGHVSLAIIGPPRPEWLLGTHPCSWVADHHQRATSGTTDQATPAIVELAKTRIYENLFPTAGFPVDKRSASYKHQQGHVFNTILADLIPSSEPARLQPFERAFTDIDPARDTDRWDGVRTKVLDAIESLDISPPSQQLIDLLLLPAAAISDIERMIDTVVSQEIASDMPKGKDASNARVRILRRYRATMLLRQVGLANGRVRFLPAFEAWLEEQENALNSRPRRRLGDGINNLILPSDESGKVYLAPFRPRTYCLSGELPKNTLLVLVSVNELNVNIVAHGDALTAEVQVIRSNQVPEKLAGLTIDLAVAREALLHSPKKSVSFTEIGDTAFARIERARASLISRERLRTLSPAFTDDRAVRFNVTPNPVGQPPLRIQQA